MVMDNIMERRKPIWYKGTATLIDWEEEERKENYVRPLKKLVCIIGIHEYKYRESNNSCRKPHLVCIHCYASRELVEDER